MLMVIHSANITLCKSAEYLGFCKSVCGEFCPEVIGSKVECAQQCNKIVARWNNHSSVLWQALCEGAMLLAETVLSPSSTVKLFHLSNCSYNRLHCYLTVASKPQLGMIAIYFLKSSFNFQKPVPGIVISHCK